MLVPQVAQEIEYPPTPLYWGLYYFYRFVSLIYTVLIAPFNLMLRIAKFLPVKFCEWVIYFTFRPVGIMADLLTLPLRLIIYAITTPFRGLYQLITIGVLMIQQFIKIPYVIVKTICNLLF